MRHALVSGLVLTACGSSDGAIIPLSEAPAPTVDLAVQVPTSATSTHSTLAADYVAAGDRAMRANAEVLTAIGTDYDTVAVEPVGTYESPVGIAFLVKTPERVILPSGTRTTIGAGEGQPSSIGPSKAAMGPASYFYVILDADFSKPVFLVVPDELAVHESGAILASTGITVVGPVMRYPTPSDDDDGMAAEVSGVLEHEGSCVYIYSDRSGERYPVLWPAGTQWDQKGEAVIPPSGVPMPIGSQVVGAGGFLYVADVERLAGPTASSLASACVDNTYGEIAVLNNADTAVALAAN
jgi:hypothetical protein